MNMARDNKTTDDLRCECGSLMARLTERSIELKCRRCKRVRVILLPIKEVRRRKDLSNPLGL